LPYLEQGNLYQTMQQGLPADYLSCASVSGPWWSYPGLWQAGQTRLSAFLCPSDDAYANNTGTLVSAHTFLVPGAFYVDLAFFNIGSGGDNIGRSDYAGVAGYDGIIGQPSDGIFTNRSRVTPVQVAAADGASNTLLFGEYLGDSDSGQRHYAGSWMGIGAIPTAFGLGTGANSNAFQFTSAHPGIIQFCYADGSVHAIRKNADVNNFIWASGWHEGQVVNFDLISN
jgi:hypothetical protein